MAEKERIRAVPSSRSTHTILPTIPSVIYDMKRTLDVHLTVRTLERLVTEVVIYYQIINKQYKHRVKIFVHWSINNCIEVLGVYCSDIKKQPFTQVTFWMFTNYLHVVTLTSIKYLYTYIYTKKLIVTIRFGLIYQKK